MADRLEASKAKRQGMMTAVGCCLVLTCIGGGATLPNIVFPSVCAELNVTVVEIGLYVLVSTFVAFLSGLAGVRLFNFLTPRWTLLSGVVTIAICMAMAGCAQSLFIFVLSGVFSGYACATTFPPIASLMNLHFRENSGKLFGLTTGIQVFLVAGMIKLVGFLLRDHSYRFVMLASAVVIIAVGCSLCFLLIRQPKRAVWIARLKEDEARKAAAKGAASAAPENDEADVLASDDPLMQGYTVKGALTKPALYLFSLGMIAGAMITGAMSSFGSSFFVSFGMTQVDAADMMSLYTLFCGVHVLWTGFFQAKFGSRIFIIVQYVGIIAGLALLVLWAGNQSIVFVVLGLFLVAFIKPINSTPALLLPDLFGRKHFLEFNSLSTGVYYGGICINSQSTSAILALFGGVYTFAYMAVVALVALVVFNLAIALSPMKKCKNERGRMS